MTIQCTCARLFTAVHRKIVFALFLALCSSLGDAQDFRFITFEVSGAGNAAGQGTSVAGVNLFGIIAGSYTDAKNISHSYLREPSGSITTFDPPGTAEIYYPAFNGSGVFALNALGSLGGYFVDKKLRVHGYVRSPDGKFTTYDWPGECATNQRRGCHGSGVWDINDFGVIVGPYEDTSGKFVAHTAVRFPDGVITTFEVPGSSMKAGQGTLPTSFSGLNNYGATTGLWYDANYNFHAYLRSPDGTFTDFEAPDSDATDEFYGTLATSLNDFGAITGYYLDPNGVYHGFLRSPNGNFTEPLDAPGADLTPGNFNGTFPSMITSFGVIAGSYSDVNGANHGFVLSPGGRFTTFDAPGAGTGAYQGTIPVAAAPFGRIAGYYVDSSNVSHGFLALACANGVEDGVQNSHNRPLPSAP